MKELLQQYSAYNLWANKTLIHSISELSDAQINHQITSSFPSLYKTLLHMLDTESVWFQRLKLAEQPVAPSTINVLSYTGITNQLLETSAIWNDWMKKATEMSVTHVFEYRNTKKEAFKQPVYQVVLHLINHQSYHRGQLVTMLRQLGIDKIPPTDFIVFMRKK